MSRNNIDSDSNLDISGLGTEAKTNYFYSNSKNTDIEHDPFSVKGKKAIEHLQLNGKGMTAAGDNQAGYNTLETQHSEVPTPTNVEAKLKKQGLGENTNSETKPTQKEKPR
jgi:hypothetical protein